MLNKLKETMKKPKCISCDKTLRRVTQDIRNQKESYKGNLICYMKKKIIVDGFLIPSLNIKQGDTIYSYRLWDGESYHYYLGKYKFCGVNCAAKYGIKQLTNRN